MYSPINALISTTLSLSLMLGSSVALAEPAGGEEVSADEAPPPVSEEEKSEAEKLSEEAIGKFQEKDFEGAAALFEKAYSIDPQPNYLFNIGRVYEEAGDLEKAVEFYGKFVKQPGVDLDSRGVALERLKVLREILEQTQEPQQGEEPEEPTEPEEPEEVEPVEPPPPEPVDDGSAKKRKSMRGAGFGLLGVGAAAVIGGAVTGGLAQGDNNSASEAATPAESQDLLDSSRTKALVADVLFGVGGALVLTGVILVAVGSKKPKGERVAVTPTFGPRGAGATLRLRF